MKLLIISSLFLSGILAQFDYCTVCPDHVACLNSDRAWGSTCPPDAALVTLTNELINQFLDDHNSYRHLVANGLVHHLPTAANMMKLQWHPEMASIAELNVKQCEFQHDLCRNTQDGQYSGQNLWGGFFGSQPSLADIKRHIEGAVTSWFSESEHAVPGDVDSFGSVTDWYEIGHFSQVAWAENRFIGCAISMFSGTPWYSVFIACNYGPGNMMGAPIYNAGPVASQCNSRDILFPSLCTS